MANQVFIVGHKNPDNDSIAAAVSYAYLKNALEAKKAEPEAEESGIKLGDKVRHDAYGVGTVIALRNPQLSLSRLACPLRSLSKRLAKATRLSWLTITSPPRWLTALPMLKSLRL